MSSSPLSRRGTCAVLIALTISSCTTMREVPRAELAARPERKGVAIETRDGLFYQFDYATFEGDTMSGYRERADLEGPFGHVTRVRVALEDITRLSVRTIDWYRTGLIGGGVIGAALGVGLGSGAIGGGEESSSGGGGGRLPD